MNFLRRCLGKGLHFFHELVSKILKKKGVVLMLHNVVADYTGDAKVDEFSVDREDFLHLLSYLKKRNVIRLENWEQHENFYALSIDDVPENFYYNAFPLLVKYKIPFTVFVNISLLDKKGYINRSQLLEMSKSGLCTVGSHGINHFPLFSLNKKELCIEFQESKRILEDIVGHTIELFAYPFGSFYACGFSDKSIVKAFYRYAFGTVGCPICSPCSLSRYFLPRINANSSYIKNIKE